MGVGHYIQATQNTQPVPCHTVDCCQEMRRYCQDGCYQMREVEKCVEPHTQVEEVMLRFQIRLGGTTTKTVVGSVVRSLSQGVGKALRL